MTTFTYSGYFITQNPSGTASTLKASTLDVVVEGADATLRYTRQPGEEAITLLSEILTLRADGKVINPPSSADAYTTQISWMGPSGQKPVSNVFMIEVAGGQFIMQISGNPIPTMTTAADYNAFLAQIVKTQTLTFGFYGPDVDIPYDRIMTPTIKESDRIVGSEGIDKFNAGVGKDTIFGNKGKDTILGGDGSDRIEGGAGGDRLKGGKGADKIAGGDGKDALFGNKGADTFIFRAVDESGASSKKRDVIHDFNQGEKDRIDLKAIDARAGTKKNDDFSFVGTKAFSLTKGELRVEKKSGNTFVYADVDGDGRADFAIQLKGTFNLAEKDFVL